mmetsp:Transcript_128271/g.411028  ORF Transcript_128271/g.411028 Transcript_128271/m.411028 type:complete len:248 (-) Transcript_128271:867-1610(-)
MRSIAASRAIWRPMRPSRSNKSSTMPSMVPATKPCGTSPNSTFCRTSVWTLLRPSPRPWSGSRPPKLPSGTCPRWVPGWCRSSGPSPPRPQPRPRPPWRPSWRRLPQCLSAAFPRSRLGTAPIAPFGGPTRLRHWPAQWACRWPSRRPPSPWRCRPLSSIRPPSWCTPRSRSRPRPCPRRCRRRGRCGRARHPAWSCRCRVRAPSTTSRRHPRQPPQAHRLPRQWCRQDFRRARSAGSLVLWSALKR